MPRHSAVSSTRLRRCWTVLRALIVAVARFTEAWFALILARLGIVFLRYVADWALRPSEARGCGEPIPPYVFRKVRVAVERAARVLPWESKCLARAIAAKMMLARQGFGSTIQLGAGHRDGQLHAHAWLISGDTIVVGEDGIETVTLLPR